MAQLMPLLLTVSCFSKIQIGFTFLVLAHLGSPGQRAVKRVCVCVTIKNEKTLFIYHWHILYAEKFRIMQKTADLSRIWHKL